MKLLLIHSDYLEYEAKQPIKAIAENVVSGETAKKIEEALVVFTAVEKGDERDEGAAIEKAVSEIIGVAAQVNAKNIVLYPYAHLSADLASPKSAVSILHDIEEALQKEKYTTLRAPFGWYKSFKLSCKGHPLSELSRSIVVGDETARKEKEGTVSQSLKAEDTIHRSFCIMGVDGSVRKINEFDFTKFPNLKKFADYELKKEREYATEPAHVKLMQEQELVDFEPGSDPGNFRWYPKGRLIKKILEEAITKMCKDYGAMEVETPIMYDYGHPSLRRYLDRFPARQYVVASEDKNYFLRFAACFGQFLMAHDMVISYRNLPMRMFELTKYSFRREQSGELCGIKRLRTFTMPDMHTICADVEQAKSEFEPQFELSLKWMRLLDLDFETAFRAQTDFFDENKGWYVSMVKKIGKPVLLELFDERYAYFISKFEFNFIDTQDKAGALSTVQIDVENADTYDLTYRDENGEKRRPIILHASLSGSIERNVYALLEREAMNMKKGKKAMLSFWLSPIQLRLIPVKNESVGECVALANELRGVVRVDVDDTQETVSKKIRSAEKEWVPLILVYGEKEKASGVFNVRVRNAEDKTLTLDELKAFIAGQMREMPFESSPLPLLRSKQPIFRG